MAANSFDLVDTIVAQSTPRGRAALAILRVSGPRVNALIMELTELKSLPKPRHLERVWLKEGKEVLDDVMICRFEAPASYTGEDLLEIYCHGNPVVCDRIIRAIVSRGTRLAEPGEFSRRALVNAKISVSDLEALDWTLNSRTWEGVKLGVQAKLGSVGRSVEALRDQVREVSANIEAQLDFPEHEVGDLETEGPLESLLELKKELSSWLWAFESQKKLLSGWSICLVGPPNSGKSSLFNALSGVSRSIVHDTPGTTRDSIDQGTEWEGRELTLTDTAGFRSSPDPVEQAGIDRSLAKMRAADIICWVSDSPEGPPDSFLKECSAAKWIYVGSKADLGGQRPESSLLVSSKTGQGLDLLRGRILELSQAETSEHSGQLLPDRHAEGVRQALEHLNQAVDFLSRGEPLEYCAEPVRATRQALEQVVGRIPPDEVLQSILSRFCIGK